jgi:phosphatidylinositol-3-phosphatase
MFNRTWRQWQSYLVEAVRRNALRGGKRARPSSFRPRLEALEERAVPATIGDVFYIEMENHNLTPSVVVGNGTFPIQQLLGNPAATYLNSLMTPGNANAAQSAYASDYLSVGATVHPSEPNYIWQEGGSNFGVVNNDLDPYVNNGNSNANLNTNVKLIAATGNNPASLSALLQAQFGAAGWKSYQEDMQYTNLSVPTISASGTIPNAGTNLYNGSTLFDFSPKHDGTLFFTATNGGTLNGPGPSDNTNTEAAFYAPLGQLATDLGNNTVAKYNLITPDNINNMHSGLAAGFFYHGFTYTGDQAAVAQGDNFLATIIPQIMASQAYQNNGVIVIRFDETEGGDTAQFTIPEIVISPLAQGNAYNSSITFTHSSDLKSLQELFGVSAPGGGFLGGANTPSTSDLGDLFKPGALTPVVSAPVAVEISGAGVWRNEAATGWQQLTTANASLVSVDPSGDVAIEIPGAGVWRFKDAGLWTQLTASDASQVSIAGNGIVAIEIQGAGVWRFKDVGGWAQVTTANATSLDVDAAGDVAIEIQGAGVWRYKDATAWAQLTTADASQVRIAGAGVVAIEIQGAGVWRYRDATAWTQLTTADAAKLDVDGAGDVAIEIAGFGLWRWEDTTGWAQLTPMDVSLAGIDAFGDVAVEIPGLGVRRWNGTAGWTQLTIANAALLDA